MPRYEVTSPDGQKYEVNAPDGATQEQVLAYAQEQFASQSQERGRSTGQEVGRQIGLTARYAAEGLAGVAGVVVDPINAVISKATGRERMPLQAATSQLLDRAGLPSPETPLEEVVGAGSRTLVGGGGMMRAAKAAPPAVAAVMNANPSLQAASSVVGGGAAEATKQAGGSPGAQVAAGIAGGLAPGGARFAGPAGVRAAFRGGEAGRQTVNKNIEAFADAGTTPTVGQATERGVNRAAESLLAKTPGASGVIARKAESQAAEMGSGLEGIAASLTPKSSAMRAGVSVEKGVTGEGGFVEGFKAGAKQLYDRLDRHINPQSSIGLTRTGSVLDELSKPIPGASATSRALANPKLAQIRDALQEDLKTGNGALPYEAVKAVRTRVGDMLADSALVTDVPRAQLKRLYGSLTQDMEAAAAGNPQALNALRRANNYYKAGMKRLDVLQGVIDKNGGPEKVFAAATSGTREGATTIRAVMQSLPKQGQADLAAAVIRRLGLAKPGKQNELGDVFSTETFLTNWNGLSPEAKTVLFNGRFGPQFRGDMDQVAKVAANLRQGSKVYANPSGTGPALIQASTAGALLLSLVSGNFAQAGILAGGVGASNLTARLMVNPAFVGWLGRTTKLPAGAANAQIQILQNIAAKNGDADLMAASELLQKAYDQQANQPQQDEGRQQGE